MEPLTKDLSEQWGSMSGAGVFERAAPSTVWELEELDRHLWLWVAAVLFFGVGDVATTSVGLSLQGISEAGPVTETLIHHYGLAAMFVTKTAVIGGFFLLWKVTPRPHCVSYPIGLSILGVVVTGWNLLVITAVL